MICVLEPFSVYLGSYEILCCLLSLPFSRLHFRSVSSCPPSFSPTQISISMISKRFSDDRERKLGSVRFSVDFGLPLFFCARAMESKTLGVEFSHMVRWWFWWVLGPGEGQRHLSYLVSTKQETGRRWCMPGPCVSLQDPPPPKTPRTKAPPPQSPPPPPKTPLTCNLWTEHSHLLAPLGGWVAPFLSL